VQPLEVGCIAGDRDQLVVPLPGREEAVEHVWHGLHRTLERVEIAVGLALERDAHEHTHGEAYSARVDAGAVAADDARFLEAACAAQAGGLRQAEVSGQRRIRRPAIAL